MKAKKPFALASTKITLMDANYLVNIFIIFKEKGIKNHQVIGGKGSGHKKGRSRYERDLTSC